jgi:hypothetical protein
MVEASWAGADWRERNEGGLLFGWIQKGNLNGFKLDFWILSKIGIWTLIQGFRSNKF